MADANDEMVTVTVTMTPEEYVRLKNDAAWSSRGSVSKYLLDHALGNLPRGC